MNKIERPSGGIFISEEEMETLAQTPDGRQQITVRKLGFSPSIGDNIQLALPDGSSAIGKVMNIKEVDIKGDAPRNEILMEIQPD